MIMRHCLWS